ncbi:MAG: hypothetical protein SGI77_13805 [Pirellulaceae bacterium]|nr:hypothetical protein [Pirellulaceae bacterium]
MQPILAVHHSLDHRPQSGPPYQSSIGFSQFNEQLGQLFYNGLPISSTASSQSDLSCSASFSIIAFRQVRSTESQLASRLPSSLLGGDTSASYIASHGTKSLSVGFIRRKARECSSLGTPTNCLLEDFMDSN